MFRGSLTVAFALLALAAPVVAGGAEAGGAWVKAEGRDCKLWHPDPLPGQKVRWRGRCAGGLAEDSHIAEWYTGQRPPDRCECIYKAGRAHGLGVYRWADGAVYGGEFKHGRIEGHGQISYPDNETYDGEFKNGLPNGFGTLHLPDSTRVMGKFKDGELIKP